MTAANLSSRRFAALVVALGLLLAALFGAGTASAKEAITSFETTTSTTQAGGHPDLQTSFALENPGLPEAAENVTIETPEGVFGNPNAVEQCTSVDYANEECPSASQVGFITIHARYQGDPNYLLGTAPIFTIQPSEAETALFGFIVPTLGIPIQIPVSVRTQSDYGLNFKVSEITQVTPLAGADLTFWAFPDAKEHENQRFAKGSPGRPAGCVGLADTSCIAKPTVVSAPIHPLTDNPNECTGEPQPTTLRVQTYQHPEESSEAHSSYPPVTGCEKQLFKPLLYARPTSSDTDSASGLDIILKDTQFLGRAVSPAPIRESAVTLPEGLTINPDAADGQAACADALAHFGSLTPAACPDSSKIGTVALHTPALAGPLLGSVYIGEPQPGNQYRLFMIVDGFGIHAKLIGSAKPDPQTGQVTVHFEELPQVPFDSFELHLFSSDRGLVATPTECNNYRTVATFTPWNHVIPVATSIQGFALESGPGGSPCAGTVRPFKPTLAAGTSNGQAGGFSSFSLQLNRNDGDQYLGNLNFTMPPGLTANLHGLAYCPETDILAAASRTGREEEAAPSCPASSQIGTSNVAAGPGGHPFHAIGKVFISGPYKGAPLSLAVITPAIAGPYDYGVVVVRVALNIDPHDAHVIADSDTVPEIIGGVPIRMREIRVNIDKSNFMINPTNCSPLSVVSEGVGDQGTPATFSSYFHAVNCATLPFEPSMTVRQLGSKKQTHRASNPSLRFELNSREGDANLKSINLTLPPAFEIDQNHLGNLCSKAQLASNLCAGKAAIGTVIDETPLLEKPLEGPAYAVSGFGGLPHLAFILNGQVMVTPEGESKSTKKGLRTTVPVIPDVPIGHFALTLYGGKAGYIANTTDLCSHVPVISVGYTGQNGRTSSQSAKLKSASCGKPAHRRSRR